MPCAFFSSRFFCEMQHADVNVAGRRTGTCCLQPMLAKACHAMQHALKSTLSRLFRYLARRVGLNGNSEAEACTIDMINEGIESLRSKYLTLIYQDELVSAFSSSCDCDGLFCAVAFGDLIWLLCWFDKRAFVNTPCPILVSHHFPQKTKEAYWSMHGDKASTKVRNGGAHFEYLARYLRGNASGFAVGSGLTMADLNLFDIVDLHARIFPEELKAEYPELMSHSAKVAELPGVREYLASPRRFEKVNGNGLG